ncbi:response regulator [Roseicyclus mahoneyensis]|uniref:EamA-like transporter family protein n=1 Tax=Roseicyclus mahoneyensis TaxID=164332 RepID=A0A316GF73_9RHOB|nr:response regulator [Roseicyclus mahoneyensis]PWK59243.1 EamA-like transporter family protein [Roseicyclus mahoneyensis]
MGARVLVVDDSASSRRKLVLALRNLGHDATEAASGEAALAQMAGAELDLVLLDILMPGIDGFAVLRHMQADPALAEIPVLVISGLDGDADSVAQAIELGASDFLPKQFEPAVFRARVQSCIEKARLRRAELDHLRQVDRLITAAERMESSTFHPDRLGLTEVAARADAVGRLGRVFRDMAEQVYDRERQLQRNIRTAKGTALLLFMGVMAGLEAPISILLYAETELALGLAFWVNLVAGLICFCVALARGKVGPLTHTLLAFLFAWAVLKGLSTVIMLEAAGRVTGIMLSIILALEAFTVFLIAALMRIEETSTRRFLGLLAGMAGVLFLLVARDRIEGVNDWLWILVALTIPVMYGLMDVLLDQRHPAALDPTAGVGLMLLISAALTFPVAVLGGQFFVLSPAMGPGAFLIVFEGLRTAAVYVSFVYLIAVAGAVFGSQAAYVSTAAGIGWSILLLGEALSLVTLTALALIFIGLAMVGPKREAEDVEVRFVPRRKRTGQGLPPAEVPADPSSAQERMP